MPINLITELANTNEGVDRLIDIKAVPNLIRMLDDVSVTNKHKKALLWILARICNYTYLKHL